jgi:hypothetical protein
MAINSLKMAQRLAAADAAAAERARRRNDDMLAPIHGPCAGCGVPAPRGLAPANNRSMVCATCLDDATGFSAQHSLPRPAR